MCRVSTDGRCTFTNMILPVDFNPGDHNELSHRARSRRLTLTAIALPAGAAESVGQAASNAATKTGHAAGEAGRATGHAAAEAGRKTKAVAKKGVRKVKAAGHAASATK